MNDMIILGKESDIIRERIQRIETGLVQVGMRDVIREEQGIAGGLLYPIHEDKGNITGRMEHYNVPGVGIAVINDYEIEWAKSFGVKNVITKEQITVDTLFEAASTSKAFTATVALHFVEKRILDLDEFVNEKLVDWRIPENEDTTKNKITLRQLLTHTSGINRPDSGFENEEGKGPTLIQMLNGEPPALNDPLEVVFTPGTKHQYSNFGYVVIEKLLQDVIGMNFSDIMKKTVVEPLEMKNSTFEYPSEEMKKQTIVPHDINGEAKESGLTRGASAHGGMISTPLDMGKYVVELMNAYQGKSNKILSSSMVRKMMRSELALDPRKFFGYTGQGLGVFLIEEKNDLFFVHPGGNEPGTMCMMIGSPTTGQGVVIMSNGANAWRLHNEIMLTVAHEYVWPLWKE